MTPVPKQLFLKKLSAFNRREGGGPLVLAADFALFLVLIVVYLVMRAGVPAWPRPFHFPSGLMTMTMIMFLGASSFVMQVALRQHIKGQEAMAQRMIALVLVGWFSFVFLLMLEWGRLYLAEHVTLLSNPWNVALLGVVYYGLTFYVTAHVAVGTVWLIVAAQNLGRFSLRSLTLFVHLTTALFVVVAFFVILSSTDLAGF